MGILSKIVNTYSNGYHQINLLTANSQTIRVHESLLDPMKVSKRSDKPWVILNEGSSLKPVCPVRRQVFDILMKKVEDKKRSNEERLDVIKLLEYWKQTGWKDDAMTMCDKATKVLAKYKK